MRSRTSLEARRWLAVAAIGVVGCGGAAGASSPPAPRPAAAPAASDPLTRLGLPRSPAARHSCSDAAAGFEASTRSIRPPESTMLMAIRERCIADTWPAAAVDCFAMMVEGDLGRCAGILPTASRDRMFAMLGSGGHGEAGGDAASAELSLAISAAKLELLQVGVPACEAFLITVRRALACVAMPIEMRVQLGAETADFWSLPSSGLPPSAQQKMSDVCNRSQAKLADEVVAQGCQP